MSLSNKSTKSIGTRFVERTAKSIAASVLAQAPAKTASRKLASLTAQLRKNTLESEIAMGEAIKAGIVVSEVVADKRFSERLVRSGIIPRRTLQYAHESNQQRFTPAQSERIVRTLRVTGLAQDAFGDGADEWLDRSTPVFSGATPAEMLVTEAGARAVEMFLGQAMHGFAA